MLRAAAVESSKTPQCGKNGDYGVIGIHVNGTHKCCIGTDSKSTTWIPKNIYRFF